MRRVVILFIGLMGYLFNGFSRPEKVDSIFLFRTCGAIVIPSLRDWKVVNVSIAYFAASIPLTPADCRKLLLSRR